MLWLACLLTVRNQWILTAWNARQEDNARRAVGLPPRPRRRRCKTLTDLATAGIPQRHGRRTRTSTDITAARQPGASGPALKQPGTGTQARHNRQNRP